MPWLPRSSSASLARGCSRLGDSWALSRPTSSRLRAPPPKRWGQHKGSERLVQKADKTSQLRPVYFFFLSLSYKPKVKSTYFFSPVRNLHANTPWSKGDACHRALPSPGAYFSIPTITSASFVMGGHLSLHDLPLFPPDFSPSYPSDGSYFPDPRHLTDREGGALEGHDP